MLTINGIPILSLTLDKPAKRAWWASLDVDVAAAAPAVGARVTISGGLSGTVVRRTVDDTRIGLEVVGGAGGLRTVLSARHYGPGDRLLAARDALRECGELLAPASNLASVTNALVRPAVSCGAWLDLLSPSWRVLDDGSVFVGVEPVSAATPTVLEIDRALNVRKFVADDLSLSPRSLFEGATITRVRYIATADRLSGYFWS